MLITLILFTVGSTWVAAQDRGLHVPFIYEKVDHLDPKYFGRLRDAMVRIHLNVKGIEVISMAMKWEGIRAKYKVSYKDALGQTCFIKWTKGPLDYDVAMPNCRLIPPSSGVV